jgi:hypothetical protein
MRTIIIIASVVMIAFVSIPQRTLAQARATATVTATVIPSVSIELSKSNKIVTRYEASPLTMNLRGTDNILVVVDSKDVKSSNILQLSNERSVMVNLPVSKQAGKTSITYLSS